MKTRIVFPEQWEDEKYAGLATALETKVLFNYLTNNLLLGLTKYSHVNDRRIMFDTGLNKEQLETGKKELSDKLHWVFFYKDWQYHNHKCAYMDYQGQPKVLIAKDKELSSIPQDVKDYFKGLITRYQGVVNLPKTESISKSIPKPESKPIYNTESNLNTTGIESQDYLRLKKHKESLLHKLSKPLITAGMLLFLLTKPAQAHSIKLKYRIINPKLTISSHKFSSPTPIPLPDGTREKPAPGGLENKSLTVLSKSEAENYARNLARQYKINEEAVICTFMHESGLNSRWPNGTLKCGDGGASCGTGQIKIGTWQSMRKHAGWSTDDLRGDDIENIKTTVYGLATLWKYHWTGYRICESMGLRI